MLPAHPRLKKYINDNDVEHENIFILNPLSYIDFLGLVSSSDLVLTDSGGLQEETTHLNVKCLTLRNETEWIELVKLGWNLLVRPSDLSSNSIIKSRKFLDKNNNSFKNIYGNGKR